MNATVSGIWLGRVSLTTLDRLHDAAREAAVTYDHAGSTLNPQRWPHRQLRTRELVLGKGPEVFRAAVTALGRWAPQRGIGAVIHPPDAAITTGTTVLVVLRFGPVDVVAVNRVVAVIDEPNVYGFAYGTLPGHAERGEESFVIRRNEDGTVVATITVDARHGTPMAWALAPFVRGLQEVIVGRYLSALHRAVQIAP